MGMPEQRHPLGFQRGHVLYLAAASQTRHRNFATWPPPPPPPCTSILKDFVK
ncbi:hypothetical protein HanIR_Chr17g0886091 [Helianthus annuus]|nr:hypothetical protein HanIR_Chr17g0886091 [Helianthus annuus]